MISLIGKLFCFYLLICSYYSLASVTRTIDADTIKSSDHTKTWSLPSSTSGTFVTSGTLTQETPSGTINGSNVTFTLANTPASNSSVQVYLDGVILIQTTDYTISGSTITMTTAPANAQKLYVVYSIT